MSEIGFLATPAASDEAQALFDEDVSEMGFVMNVSRLWAYQPATVKGLFDLMRQSLGTPPLTLRQRGILVTACASTLGDSYCSIAWGVRLAKEAGPGAAAGVLQGDDQGLEPDEQAIATWARKVARNPNAITSADIEPLRSCGFNDGQIFAMTVFVALRLAFSVVNDALGAAPDAELFASAPPEVASVVTYGRPPSGV